MALEGKMFLAFVAVFFVLGCAQLQPPAQPLQNATPPAQVPAQPPPLPPLNMTIVANATEPAPPNETLPAMPQNISSQYNASNASAAPAGLEFGNYSLVLEDLLLTAGADRISCASLAIYDSANSTKLARLVVCPGESAYWIAPNGRMWRIVVYQTAPGYAGSEQWAEMAVFG